jgi:hypothetical protein
VTEIGDFASSLLEEAKRFLERAEESPDKTAQAANLHAALMLAFCALEAHLNVVSDEVAQWSDVTDHQRSVLLEKEIGLKEGDFVLGNKLQMFRIMDRLQVLHRIAKGKIQSGPWQQNLSGAIDLRNKLTHPKTVPTITVAAVKSAITAVIETLDTLYLAVYRRRFPVANRRLQSKMDF